MKTKENFDIHSFLDRENKSLEELNKQLADQEKLEIELAISSIKAEFAQKAKEAKDNSQKACCEEVLNFVRQRRNRFEECLKLLHCNKNKDLEIELLQIGKEIGDLFGRSSLFRSAPQYEFRDKAKFSFEKLGLGPELESFQNLIRKIWVDRYDRRERMFGKRGFHQYMPWFVFLSGVGKSSTVVVSE